MSFPARSKLFRYILLAWLFFVQGTVAHAFSTNQCAADRYGSNLNCTANDVSITGMTVVGDTTSCVGGATVTLDLQMTINFATPDRYDVGVFIPNDGLSPQDKSASGGAQTCSVSVLPISSPFLNLDSDSCGDGNGTLGGNTGTGIHYMTGVPVKCQSLAGANGNLYIPFVVSWDQQTTNTCSSAADPVPGTSSKCNSPTVTQGSVAVVVLPSITINDGITQIASGDATTYTVTISNTTGISLSGVVFKDPVVSGITLNSVTCSASGGASCPASSTVTAIQSGSGLTLPTLPAGGSLSFSIGATLSGNSGETRTNAVSATVSGQSNTASDTDTIVGTIALLPATQAKNGDKGAVIPYTFTLYNNGATTDTITLSAVSSKGWSFTLSSTSVTLAAGASTTVTLNVTVKASAAVGTVDTTTITATSGVNPSKSTTATAITTVTNVLTLSPSNVGTVGGGATVYYTHRVQNNDGSRTAITLAHSFTAGTCTGWSAALYESNKTTALTSPVTVAVNGGYKDFVLKVTAASGAARSSSCTATLTAAFAAGSASTQSVTDVTTVKDLVIYQDPGYTTEQNTYPASNNVYAKTYGLTNGTPYYYIWRYPNGTVARTSPTTSNLVTLPDTYTIPGTGPLGTWKVEVWNATTNTIFDQTIFYVGPDHVAASFSGASQGVNTNVVVDLALHDKTNHTVPFDSANPALLVYGGANGSKDALLVTVTVSGTATIVSTTLENATISGQSVTGKLSSSTGTATLTITDTVAETVTVTPASYNMALYGASVSPSRDHGTTVTFAATGSDHFTVTTSGNGVTCQQEQVTITAHNASHGAMSLTNTTTINLSATLGPGNGGAAAKGTWSAPSGLQGTFVAGTADSGTATYTFPAGGASSVTLNYQNTWGQTVNFNVSSGSATERTGAANADSPYDPDQIWALAGFRFVDGSNADLGTQTAGVTSGTFYLQPAAASCSTPGAACAGVCADLSKSGPFANGNTVNIDMAYACTDPSTCSCTSAPATCAGAGSPTLRVTNNDGNTYYVQGNNGSASSYIQVPLKFSTAPAALCSGTTSCTAAPFTLNFTDVGKLALAARYSVSPGGGGSPSGSPMTGSSNPFVVKPWSFAVLPCTGSGACSSAFSNGTLDLIGNGSVFAKAGETFSATVKALAADNSVTPNFGKGTAASDVVVLSATNVGICTSPATLCATTGSIGGTSSIAGSSFTNGVASVTDLTYSDVGVITLKATNSSYLGQSGNTVGSSGNLGRFVPDRLTVTSPTVTPWCGGASGFTYFGQDGFTTAFTLTAQASVGLGYATTSNYYGNFAKLNLGTWTQCDQAGNADYSVSGYCFSAATLPSGAVLAKSSTSPTGVWASGTAAVSARHQVSRPTTMAPPLTLTMRTTPRDSDGATTSPVDLGTATLYYGRLHLANAFGSERLPLSIFSQVEYLGPSGWVLNANDNCTVLPAPSVTPVQSSGTSFGVAASFNTAHLINGAVGLSLSAPGTGNTGYVDVLFDLAFLPWLQLSSMVNNNQSRATFGIYKSNSRVVYRRERY